jgi:uncharacterized protein (DUF2147 family)
MVNHSICWQSLALSLFAFSPAAASDVSIEGIWLTADGEGWIEIRMQDGRPSGFIAGSPNDPENLEPPEFDGNNPDPSLRGRPLFGLEILHSLRPSGMNIWKGKVYDPTSGKTYKCKVTLVDAKTLRIRGYLGISLLGRTQVWTRMEAAN